ncbi:MAG: hypothetical protein V7L23_15345 [Nostoc sp.]|uniref:hypothetical protein n=1 Tax=Nostoc sp. TaxID=1180 RepID=UPI002FF2449E
MQKISLINRKPTVLIFAADSNEKNAYLDGLPEHEIAGMMFIENFSDNWRDVVVNYFGVVDQIVFLDGWEKRYGVSPAVTLNFVNSQRLRAKATPHLQIRDF